MRGILFGACLLLTLLGSPPADAGPEIEVYFRYGLGSGNILDSSHDSFTKDMGGDPDTTIALVLEKEDLERILARAEDVDFFAWPDTVKPDCSDCSLVTIIDPASSYTLRIRAGKKSNEVFWVFNMYPSNRKWGRRFGYALELGRLIIDLINSREEVKALPPGSPCYL